MSDENQNVGTVSAGFEKKKVKKTKPNTSGQGADSVVPEIVSKRFNWGAFFLTWIWGIGNKSYKTFLIFLALIPFIGILIPLPLQIWFGIKGNEWAWRNKRFKGVNSFHNYQKKWAIAAVVVFIVGLLFSVIFYSVMLGLFMNSNIQG